MPNTTTDTHLPMATSLGTLMERYVDGDDRAFSDLYAQMAPRLRRQIRSKISDPDVAEELLQASFLRAHTARGRFFVKEGSDPDRAVWVWYSAIVRNAAIDHLRKIYRLRAAGGRPMNAEANEAALLRVADPDPSMEDAIAGGEQRDLVRAAVRDAIDALPNGQREVVQMHKLEGMSMREISSRLKVREGTLRVRAHRAYKALAERLRLAGLAPTPA